MAFHFQFQTCSSTHPCGYMAWRLTENGDNVTLPHYHENLAQFAFYTDYLFCGTR